jgi:hypothetical protein
MDGIKSAPARCNHAACVRAEKVEAGVLLTSTIPTNQSYILYTQEEWDTFVSAVKAGEWDHTLSGVPATV